MSYAGMSIEEHLAKVTAERQHSEQYPRVIEMWGAFTQEVRNAEQSLRVESKGLGNQWGATGDPVDPAGQAFLTRANQSGQSLSARAEAPDFLAQALGDLKTRIGDTHAAITALKAEADQVKAAGTSPTLLGGSINATRLKALEEASAGLMDQLGGQFSTAASQVRDGAPNVPWSGPEGASGVTPLAGGAGASGAAAAPNVTSSTGVEPTPAGSAGGAGDPSEAGGATAGDESAGGAGGGAGDESAGGASGAGAGGGGGGLAGNGTGTPTLPRPTIPGIPGGPTLPPQPPTSLPPLPPLGLPLPPRPAVPVASLPGSAVGKGLGIGSGVIGSRGIPRLDLGGIGAGSDSNGPSAPAQAARQMSGRMPLQIPATPVPAAPPTTGATGGAGAGAGGMPPPMMPPMAPGQGGAGAPRPGNAERPQQGRGKPSSLLAGVPPKLRGRSGKTDPTTGLEPARPSSAASRRRRTDADNQVTTVQLLDEELWEVKEHHSGPTPAGNGTPAPTRRGGRRLRT